MDISREPWPGLRWADLIVRFGPVGTARDAPHDLLLAAARDGRLFRVSRRADGYGSGDVWLETVRQVPNALEGGDEAVVWEVFYFTGDGVVVHLESAADPGWDRFSDVPGLPCWGSRIDLAAPLSDHEASDPLTSPARLAELSTSSDARVLADVARNPSTPVEVLLALARRCPVDVLANPRLSSLRREYPDLLSVAPADTVAALMGVEDCPSWVFDDAARHPDVRVRVNAAMHPRCPRSALSLLTTDTDEVVRRQARATRPT